MKCLLKTLEDTLMRFRISLSGIANLSMTDFTGRDITYLIKLINIVRAITSFFQDWTDFNCISLTCHFVYHVFFSVIWLIAYICLIRTCFNLCLGHMSKNCLKIFNQYVARLCINWWLQIISVWLTCWVHTFQGALWQLQFWVQVPMEYKVFIPFTINFGVFSLKINHSKPLKIFRLSTTQK